MVRCLLYSMPVLIIAKLCQYVTGVCSVSSTRSAQPTANTNFLFRPTWL